MSQAQASTNSVRPNPSAVVETMESAEPLGAMSRRESLYLDLLRSLAAFIVIFDHAPNFFDMPHTPRLGHQAVMLFFVLSGYVICQVADTRETTARAFVVARFARLWSVLVPALALTVICELIVRGFGQSTPAPVDWPLIRIGAAIGFLSESWISVQPLSNGVIWSLCAEFWYYMLFAAWVFVPPGPLRAISLGLAVLFAGHKALLLLPIWLMGVALQRSRTLRRIGPGVAAAFWAIGLAAIACVLAMHLYDPAISFMQAAAPPWAFTQLAQARVFWFDWLFGLAVAAHILGARTVAAWVPMERIATPVRWCASISFAAYLFHMPLLHLWAAFLPRSQGGLAILLTLAVIAALGPPTECSKRWWRRQLDAVIDAARLAPLRPIR